MTRAQHTLGPWTPDVSENVQNASILGADGKLVTASEYDGFMVPFACRDKEEADANVRLVCAAPELLETVKWVRDQCGYASPWYIKIETLIAKIEGRVWPTEEDEERP